MNYREPFSKKLFLRAGLRYEYEKLENNIATFDDNSGTYNQQNQDLSSAFFRNSNRYFVTSGIEFKQKDLSITPGVKYQYQQFDNKLSYLADPLVQKLNNVLPYLEITYKKLTVNFTRDVILPDYNYMIPVNNTNPYLINLEYQFIAYGDEQGIYEPEHFQSKNNLNVWNTGRSMDMDNDVVQSTYLDESGVQTNLPINAITAAAWQLTGLNQVLNTKTVIFSWNFGTWTEYRRINFSIMQSRAFRKDWCNIWSNIGFNWNDKLEVNPAYSFSYMNVNNSNPLFATNNSFEQTIGMEMIVRYVKHVIFETEGRYLNNNAL